MCLFVFSAFYCLFVPSFVSILHSNLFSSQTNRWWAAICKTEQGSKQSARKEARWWEGEGWRKKKEKGRSGEERSIDAWKKGNRKEDSTGKGRLKRKIGRGVICPLNMSKFSCFLAWWLRSTLCSPGCKLTSEMSLLRQGEGLWSLSSRDLASVSNYRGQADGGKLAKVLEP